MFRSNIRFDGLTMGELKKLWLDEHVTLENFEAWLHRHPRFCNVCIPRK
jgi:hypothetical protein